MEKISLKGFGKKKVGRPSGRGENFKLKTARSMLRKRMDNGKSYVLQQNEDKE